MQTTAVPAPIVILAASPSGAGLPPAPPVEVTLESEEPRGFATMDRYRAIERALGDAQVLDEQPGASWSRADGQTQCDVVIYAEGEEHVHARGCVEGEGAEEDFRSWLQALGRALAWLASGQPCGCPRCVEERLPEEAR